MRLLCCFDTSRMHYAVTRRHIPEKRMNFFRNVYAIKMVNLSRSTFRRSGGMAPFIMNITSLAWPTDQGFKYPGCQVAVAITFLTAELNVYGSSTLISVNLPTPWILRQFVDFRKDCDPYHRLRCSFPDSMTSYRWSDITECRLKDIASVRKSSSRSTSA